VRQEEFPEVACMVLDSEVRRISRGPLYVFFYCEESRLSRENLYGFVCGAKRISRGRLHGFWLSGEENFKYAPPPTWLFVTDSLVFQAVCNL